MLDGHPLAKQGQAARAFGAGYAASLIGGIFGAALLAVAIPVLRPVVLYLASPELLSFCIFGLSMVGVLSGKAPLKGLTAAGARPDAGDDRQRFADRHAALDLRLALSVGPSAAGAGDARHLRDARARRHGDLAHQHRRPTRRTDDPLRRPVGGHARRAEELVAHPALLVARRVPRRGAGAGRGGDRLDRLWPRRAHREEHRAFRPRRHPRRHRGDRVRQRQGRRASGADHRLRRAGRRVDGAAARAPS